MNKIEQIDWEAVDTMVATQIVRVIDMIREIDVTQELDSKTFTAIKGTIIERTIDSIIDQLYYAFRYEEGMEWEQKLAAGNLSAKLRKALESDEIPDHSPIREEIKHMYHVRLLIERDYVEKRSDSINTRLEEVRKTN